MHCKMCSCASLLRSLPALAFERRYTAVFYCLLVIHAAVYAPPTALHTRKTRHVSLSFSSTSVLFLLWNPFPPSSATVVKSLAFTRECFLSLLPHHSPVLVARSNDAILTFLSLLFDLFYFHAHHCPTLPPGCQHRLHRAAEL